MSLATILVFTNLIGSLTPYIQTSDINFKAMILSAENIQKDELIH